MPIETSITLSVHLPHMLHRARVAMLASLLLLTAAACALARPIDNPWNRSTQVSPNADSGNATCDGLAKAMHNRVLSINQLQLSIDKDLKNPPPTVTGLMKSWMGKPYTSELLKTKQSKLAKEMGMAKELNQVAATVGCAHIDIDEEVRKEAAKVLPPGSH